MKLLLLSDTGEILDTSDEFDRDEWDAMTGAGALAILDGMSAGPR